MTRLKCHLTGARWRDYVRGIDTAEGRLEFTDELAAQRDEAFQRIVNSSAGSRLHIVDRSQLSDHRADHLAAIVNEHRDRVGAQRALIVVDYLQLLELGDKHEARSDLEADKARFRLVQQIAEMTRSPDDPFSSAVVAISEARKPVGDARKNLAWGTAMADLMGTSRLGYGADAVLMMRRMNESDLSTHYNTSNGHGESQMERLRTQGISPLVLSIGKGRDGMTLADIPLEFEFFRSTMRELQSGSRMGVPRSSRSRQRQRGGASEEAGQ